MSLYIRVYTNFYTHRKTVRLRAMIGDSALWVLPRLWAYAAEHQSDGIFQGYSPEEIAIHVGYHEHPPKLIQSLVTVGFMDDSPLRIHDWEAHNGYHKIWSERASQASKIRWEKEKRKEKKRKETSNAKKLTSTSISNASSMKPTLEAVKLCCSKMMVPVSDAEWFFNKCEGNGWTNSGRPIVSWQHTIASWKAGGFLPSQKQAVIKQPPRNQI